MPLFFIFIIVPIIELMLLIEVGGQIGTGWTFLIIIATAILGTKLVKQQGLSTWSKIQQELASGTLPAKAMFEGICILISGVLLITPGFLTDIIGLLLLTPVFRTIMYSKVGHRVNIKAAGFSQGPYGHSQQSPFQQGTFQQDSYKQGETFDHAGSENSNANNNTYNNTQSDNVINKDPSIIDADFERKD